jgi:hypothetical protein
MTYLLRKADMKAINMFLLGDRILREEHQEASKKKLGVLRGGSAGCLLGDGTTIGCPHEALGRFLGYEANSILSQGYFDGGMANETIWERNAEVAIKHPDSPYNAFRCEEDIPVLYQLGKYKITGRPDLVYGTEVIENNGDVVFLPKLGTELKASFSVSAGAKRIYGLKPDAKHLCQAGFYMRALDCPAWTIPYTVNVTGDLGFFDKRNYAPEKKLVLGKVEFPIEWRGDILYYQKPSGEWLETIITWQGILDYYGLIVEMYEDKKVGMTTMSDRDADGNQNPFDYNIYNDFTNMVPTTGGWEVFVKYAALMATSTKFIKFKAKKYYLYEIPLLAGPYYTAQGIELGTYSTLTAARAAMYEED